MICHQDKCLFVHIPKTAGQSIESVFVERMGLTWQEREILLLKPNGDSSKGPPRLAHLMASEYTSCGHISTLHYQQYYKFSFVRNPWARIVSEYNYRRLHGDEKYQTDFKTFLFKNFPTKALDDHVSFKDYYRHILPQWKFLFDDNGFQLVDFIGKFENIQVDFNTVCEQLNILPTQLPHKNRTLAVGFKGRVQQKLKRLLSASRKKHYSFYYDNESQQFIAEYYKKDIELFNYAFEVK